MTERFKLAANVLLSRRLNSLLRIDENVEIDKSYITCAEYQLFIDEKRSIRKNYQPDHWKSKRFPLGDAKKPITGVRARDAEDFCEWLTQKQVRLGFKYQLPTSIEVEENPALDQQVGCWCKNKQEFQLVGIKSEQWEIWQAQLNQVLILSTVPKYNIYHKLYRVLDRYYIINLYFYRKMYELYRDLDRILKRDLIWREQ